MTDICSVKNVPEWLNEPRCYIDGKAVEAAYSPGFAEWLVWLDSDDTRVKKESGSPENYKWAKSLLARWREAGCPCPSEWPETKNRDWLRPPRSDWPSIAR